MFPIRLNRQPLISVRRREFFHDGVQSFGRRVAGRLIEYFLIFQKEQNTVFRHGSVFHHGNQLRSIHICAQDGERFTDVSGVINNLHG